MTTHTSLIKRLREARKDHTPTGVLLALISESADALESLEQQVAALRVDAERLSKPRACNSDNRRSPRRNQTVEGAG